MEAREQHVAWSKQRALEYLDAGDVPNAYASMVSDMGKREDCKVQDFLAQLGMLDVIGGNASGLRRWIEGFN